MIHTKIVPYNYGLDEEMVENPDISLVGIEEMSITYMQEPDTNSTRDEYQHLTITSKTAMGVTKEDAEKGDAFYFDITIPDTEHWSVCDGEDLKVLIDDFKKRLYMETSNKKK